MSNIYYFSENNSFKLGDIVLRVGTTKLDNNDVIRGYKQVGKVVDIKTITYGSKIFYLYYVNFYDINTYQPLYDRAIAVLGKDLVLFDPSKGMSYYYDLVNSYTGKPIVYSLINSNSSNTPKITVIPSSDDPIKQYTYRSKRETFQVGDKVVRDSKRFGSVGYRYTGTVVAVFEGVKMPNSDYEHYQVCLVNFKRDIDLVMIPSADLELAKSGSNKHIVVRYKTNRLKLSNEACLIVYKARGLSKNVAETLYEFGTFDSYEKDIEVDKTDYDVIKTVVDDMLGKN